MSAFVLLYIINGLVGRCENYCKSCHGPADKRRRGHNKRVLRRALSGRCNDTAVPYEPFYACKLSSRIGLNGVVLAPITQSR
jgi:hypothetical protein